MSPLGQMNSLDWISPNSSCFTTKSKMLYGRAQYLYIPLRLNFRGEAVNLEQGGNKIKKKT